MTGADKTTPLPRSLLYVLSAGRLAGAAGATMAMAFFTVYLRRVYGLPLPAVGTVAGLMSVGAMAGTFVGGMLSDRIGRRPALLLTLAAEALALLGLSLVHGPVVASALGTLVGTAEGALWPTFGASVADIVPPQERQGGFALLAVAVNAGAAIGPAAGGLLLAMGFPRLWLTASVAVAVAFAGVWWRMPETRPAHVGRAAAEGSAPGFGVVLRDRPVMEMLALLLPSLTAMGVLITFFPLTATATPGVGARTFGLLFALWGALIAVLQFPVSRLVRGLRPVHGIALGYLAMAVGFAPIALWPGVPGFALGIVCVAVSETLAAPPMGTLVANLAPVAARGRYQSTIGLVWSTGGALGPVLAGAVYGGLSHAQFWLAAGLLCALPTPLYAIWATRHTRAREAEAQAMGVA